jgi:hypothetical protein
VHDDLEPAVAPDPVVPRTALYVFLGQGLIREGCHWRIHLLFAPERNDGATGGRERVTAVPAIVRVLDDRPTALSPTGQ